MQKKMCEFCGFYDPCDRLGGYIGTCGSKHGVTGFDQSCSCFSAAPWAVTFGVPVARKAGVKITGRRNA